MCKIFTMTNMSQVKSLNKFINIVSSEISERERDGFGYSIQGEKGVYGERSLSPANFRASFSRKIVERSFITPDYNRHGTKAKAIGAGIFHGRTSTNHKTLINTHPINKHGWSLIHNGVVTNHGPEYKALTTNDTEHLVEYMGTTGIKGIEENLTGYYAVTAIDPEGKLHVFRDSIAPLYFAEIMSVNSFVFATTQDLIRNVCEQMDWKYSIISPMNADTYLIFEGNEVISEKKIKPRGETASESKYSGLSLGYSRETAVDDPVSEVYNAVTGLTEDEQCFLEEVKTHADHTYSFKDYRGNDLAFDEFQTLTDEEKLYCTVIRCDGTIVDPNDYYTEKLYSGAI